MLNKEQLLWPRADTDSGMPEDDVEIPGMGTVRVRALSRKEALATQVIESVSERTAHIIALAMVDPRMSVSEVRQWMDVAIAGELEPVDGMIAELSGMTPDAGKAAYKSYGDGSEPGIRSLPGTETVDDSGADAGAGN